MDLENDNLARVEGGKSMKEGIQEKKRGEQIHVRIQRKEKQNF
jgi:hypothetical protein